MSEISIERNGVSLPFVEHEVLKGKSKGFKYLAPVVLFDTEDNWALMLQWFGKETVAGFMQQHVKNSCRDIYRDAIDPATGKFIESKFIEECKDPFAAAMKLSEIAAKLEEAQATLGRYVDQIPDEGESSPELRSKIKESRAYVVALKAMLEARRRKKPEEAEETEDSEPAVAVQ